VNNIALVVHRCCSESSDRKILYGGVKSIIDRNLSLFPWLTRSQVYYAVNKIKGDAPDSTAAVSHIDPNSTRQLVITNNSSIASCSNPSTIKLNSTAIVQFNPVSISEPGCPKGTTINKIIDASRRKKEATYIISIRYAKMKE